MKCLILAAGLGSRLREVSESKPLTRVQGVPLIEHVVTSAAAAGASNFTVVTGYRAEPVERFLAELGPRLGVALDWIRTDDWKHANGFSVLAAAGVLAGDYLLLMADHLFEPDIARRLLAAPRQGVGLRLAVDRNIKGVADLEDATKVETGAGGKIVRIGKKLADYDAVDTGIFLATPALAQAIRDDVAAGGGGSLSEGVQRLADRGVAQTMDIKGACWLDVDDPDGLRLAETFLAGTIRGSAA